MGKKNTAVIDATATEVKRSPGRPRAFDVPTVSVLTNIPIETRDAVRTYATEKGVTLNQAYNTLLLRGLPKAKAS